MCRASPMSVPSPDLPGAENSPTVAATYRVFLSYSHADTTWARWLMRRLENYRVPSRFHGRSAPVGVVGPRLAPVFRDRDELPTTSDLGETIRAALRLIHSPQAAMPSAILSSVSGWACPSAGAVPV